MPRDRPMDCRVKPGNDDLKCKQMTPLFVFLFDLALKMALTATIVVVISVVVERSGPFIGALIAALPTAASAAYIIMALEHPPAFISASAIGSLAGGAAVLIF